MSAERGGEGKGECDGMYVDNVYLQMSPSECLSHSVQLVRIQRHDFTLPVSLSSKVVNVQDDLSFSFLCTLPSSWPLPLPLPRPLPLLLSLLQSRVCTYSETTALTLGLSRKVTLSAACLSHSSTPSAGT